jgi:hypothetical protein
MANTVAPEEQSIEKAVWGYVGTGVLWIFLVLSGMALDRLGLTSNFLTSILPGEVGSLRTQVAECTRDLGTVKNERDSNKLTENALRVEIDKLKKQLASAPAQPATATP